MFCQKCGAQIPDNAENVCPSCGNNTVQQEVSAKSSSKLSRLKVIIPIIIVIVVILLLIGNSENSVVSDVKDMVFEQYGTISIGEAADRYLDKVDWTSQKISDDEYIVTLHAFSEELSATFSIDFRVTSVDDTVYALASSVTFLEEEYTDDMTVTQILAMIYGKTLDEATDLYWDLYWQE